MRALAILSLVLLVVAGWPLSARAQDAQTDDSGVVFQPRDIYGSGGVQLLNGVSVDERDWRALFVAAVGEYLDKDGHKVPKTCTATLVGAGIVLTAAHCIDSEGNKNARRGAKLMLGVGQVIQLDCEMPAQYLIPDWDARLPRHPDDFALCSFTLPSPPPARLNTRFETMSLAPLTPGTRVLMTGFGCKVEAMDGNGLAGVNFDGILTIGDSAIESAPATRPFLVTRSDWKTQPALCPGDSGGPLLTGASTAAPVGTDAAPRRLVGVNSNVVPARTVAGDYDLLSKMAALGSPSFAKFLADWENRHPGRVPCGAPGSKAGYPCRD